MTTPQDPYAPPPGPGGSAPVGTPGSGWGGYGTPPAGGQQPGYGGPDYGQPPTAGTRNGLGVAALVLGVIGFFTSWFLLGGLLGLIAIGLGIAALGRVRRREASNRGMAIAGIVLGVVSLVIAVLVGLAGAAFWQNGGREFTDCVREAGEDRAAAERCEAEFNERIGALGR